MTFTDRYVDAVAHENAICVQLGRRGWSVEPFGQALLSERMRDGMRQVHYPVFWRWLPDLIACRDGRIVLVDGKYELRTDTPNFSVEMSARHAHLCMLDLGAPIVYVFGDMSCNYCDDLIPERGYGSLGGAGRVDGVRGSGTPFVLVKKSQQLHLDEIFGPPLELFEPW